MYMRVRGKSVEFNWDQANLSKRYFKHGVTPSESEEVFIDEKLIVLPDIKHSKFEERFIAIGRSLVNRSLFVVFTIRNKKIRVISARRMHKKEVKKYEKVDVKN